MSLLDFTELPAEDRQSPETFAGVIADDATQPGQPVRVVIPAFDRELAHGPCPWTPITTPDGTWYPKQGDACVVVRPVDGDPWIVGWTPSGLPQPPVGVCRVHRTASQTIMNDTWTDVDFNAVQHGDPTMFSAGHITVPVGGVYLVTAQVYWTSDSTGTRFVTVTRNASQRIAVTQLAAGSSYRQQSTGLFQLAAGDRIRVEVYQNSGGNLDLVSNPPAAPALAVQLLT